MREEEKLARDTYLTLYELWDLTIFSNISSSEQKAYGCFAQVAEEVQAARPGRRTPRLASSPITLCKPSINTLIAMGKQSSPRCPEGGRHHRRNRHAGYQRGHRALAERGCRRCLRESAVRIAQSPPQLCAEYRDSDRCVLRSPVLTQAEVDQILQTPMEKCGKNK